jgi:hypothetical protein
MLREDNVVATQCADDEMCTISKTGNLRDYIVTTSYDQDINMLETIT